MEVAWPSTILSSGKIEALTMEVKIQAFHRQLFEKSITLLEFRERQVVRICVYLTAKVCYFAKIPELKVKTH